jgi:3'-phosphoadenosine 5'-phosphosulfate sulfotransferase (PAPS reductase)/FAD synthetase
MTDLIGPVKEKISSVLGSHNRVALMYSGGLESNLLLALARPWKDRIAVFTVRTGAEFPHMVEFIDKALAGWDHQIVATDVYKFFGEVGLPAHVIPIEHQPGSQDVFGQRRGPWIVTWLECCIRNRNEPGWKAVKAAGINVVLNGQRAKDFPGPRAEIAVEGLTVHCPFWDNTRQDIRTMVAELGVEIPSHYDDYNGSLDCAICPAALTPRRRSFMKDRHPEQLATAEQLQGLVTNSVFAALSGEATFHNHSE